jgi:hypothetical protein
MANFFSDKNSFFSDKNSCLYINSVRKMNFSQITVQNKILSFQVHYNGLY